MKRNKILYLFTLLFGGVNFLWGKVDVLPAKAAEEPVRMSGYTTYYDEKVTGRSENIRLAVSFISGITVQAYGEFSFNKIVGERSEARGFKEAKVIVRGEFTSGVGGGVCQVSTTLYNAALYAGLTITEYHPHSLAVGYVPPSQDAMVSAYHDLAFFNPYDFPVRIEMTAKEGALRARIYGEDTGIRREVVSRTVDRTPPPDPLEIEGEKDEVLRVEKWGLTSESYLEIYQNGVLQSRKLLRKDAYLPTRGIVAKKTLR
ncbi:MAG: VanW family protein [Clostridia bacterium]|nr:VanW family protein [Clostridia bacterium]